MKRIISIVLILVLGFLFFGCPAAPEVAEYVPEIGFSEVSVGSSRLAIPSATGREEALYFGFMPLITGIRAGGGLVSVGTTVAAEILGTGITFTVEKSAEGNFLFDGTMDDDSGYLKVWIDQKNRTYEYEQLLFFTDPDNALQINGPMTSIIYKETNQPIQVDNNLDYQGMTTFWTYSWTDFDGESLQGSTALELYRGELNTSMEGSGYGMYKGYYDFSAPMPTHGGFTPSGKPSVDQLDDFKSYFEAMTAAVQNGDISLTEFGMLGYYDETNDVIEGDLAYGFTGTLDDFKALMPDTWTANTLISE